MSIPAGATCPEHGWCYLHAGGAIGASGAIADVDVALHGAASRILLPDPPSGDDLREAVRACLSLLDLAPDHLTVPLFGAVYRAPLCELVPTDTSVFLVGPTGVFKTELAALAMQHVGAGFDRLHLPAHWSATDNFLERIAFDFKDAPLVIDDFAPDGTRSTSPGCTRRPIASCAVPATAAAAAACGPMARCDRTSRRGASSSAPVRMRRGGSRCAPA